MINRTDAYFLTIAKTGNLNQAAQQLYVSQPSLSKYIQRLESRLGAPLFDRSVSPMKLNEAGRLYLRCLLDSMERERRLFQEVEELTQNFRGTLRLGIPSFCGQYCLPNVLPAFSREFPHVVLELHEETGDILEQALEEQKIDLAIMHLPLLREGLAYTPLTKERILLAVKRNGEVPCGQGRCIEMQEEGFSRFKGIPAIMPQNGQKLGHIVRDFLARLDYQPPVFCRTRNIATTLALAAQGMGIGFVPESGLDTLAGEILGNLSFFSFPNALSDWQLAAVRRKGSGLSVYARRLLELLQNRSGTGGSGEECPKKDGV